MLPSVSSLRELMKLHEEKNMFKQGLRNMLETAAMKGADKLTVQTPFHVYIGLKQELKAQGFTVQYDQEYEHLYIYW